DLHFFGEFILEGSADLGSVAAVYGLNLESDEEGDLPLGQFIARRLGSEPVVGDQVEWNGLTWTVAQMEGPRIQKVGLKFPEGKGMPLGRTFCSAAAATPRRRPAGPAPAADRCRHVMPLIRSLFLLLLCLPPFLLAAEPPTREAVDASLAALPDRKLPENQQLQVQ